MTTTVHRVEGMTCGHCVASVSGEISKLHGVTDVAVDLDTGEVTITSTGSTADTTLAAPSLPDSDAIRTSGGRDVPVSHTFAHADSSADESSRVPHTTYRPRSEPSRWVHDLSHDRELRWYCDI